MAAVCPACMFRFQIPPDVKPGQAIECPDCHASLVVRSIEPDVVERSGEEEEGEDFEDEL